MVEKIRESYQKHSRNVSAVSDISVSTAEPLKRDENAEIRCVLLCDSETERKCLFEAISMMLRDGESSLTDCQVVQHHWEHPHGECIGGASAGAGATSDCRLCFKVTPPPPLRDAGRLGHANGHGHAHHNGSALPTEGFFRFSMQGQVFRFLLLSKDKQNLLKLYSFDFILVGMQVLNAAGHLDQHIWEFEWKRLWRHGRKAVAPLVLFAYLRDVLKLGGGSGSGGGGAAGIANGAGDIGLRRTVEDSRAQAFKVGRKHHAIARFCDFVTGGSVQLEALFSDLERLYHSPGYVLQQCALVNNLVHFAKIIENPHCSPSDVEYHDVDGDNAIMIAAKLRHKDLLSSVLRSPKFHNTDDIDRVEFLEKLIHARNNLGQTLLSMVALQGPELEEQKLLILQIEIQIHCVSEITHEADQLKLQRCLRNQLKSSSEAAIILEQARALQGIPKTERELSAEKGKVWSKLFFASLLLSLIFNAIDTGSDILITIRYYGEMVGDAMISANNTCGQDYLAKLEPDYVKPNCSVGPLDPISIQCFPQALSPEQRFGYTLFFILVPWPFFIYEFFTSRQYQQLEAKGKQIVQEMSQCQGCVAFVKSYLKAIIYTVSFVCCFLLWPIAILFIKYYNDGKYYLAKGAQKAAREKKIEASEVLYSTARVMEVSLESSFQPTIQLYIMFPVLLRTMTASSFSLCIFTVCKNESLNLPMLKTDQTISIVTSILSLAWCFTFYHATLKRGALDKDLAALLYRLVLFLSMLFQIVGRLFILVLFSYSFGPGMYYPVLIFLAVHILIMTVLHFVFSDAKMYWEKGGFLNLSFFHYMIGNGLANIYIHNWIKMDPLLIQFSKPLQHVSTLVRQVLFDLIFVAENFTLLAIALNSNIIELNENRVAFAVILLGFSLLGLVLKCVYYRYLHIWAWLILDYITKKEDGHWKCIIFSNMYLCGELKERELLLCCVPRPIFRLLSFLFGERKFASTDTSCSRCAAVFGVFLVPVAACLGLVVLVFVVACVILFLPVFIFTILPCVVVLGCRRLAREDSRVIKVVDDSAVRQRERLDKGREAEGESFQLVEGLLEVGQSETSTPHAAENGQTVPLQNADLNYQNEGKDAGIANNHCSNV